VQSFDRADTLDGGQLGDGTTRQVSEASIFAEELFGKLDNIATVNARPKKDRQNLSIRQGINAALEEFFAGFLLVR